MLWEDAIFFRCHDKMAWKIFAGRCRCCLAVIERTPRSRKGYIFCVKLRFSPLWLQVIFYANGCSVICVASNATWLSRPEALKEFLQHLKSAEGSSRCLANFVSRYIFGGATNCGQI